MTYEALILDNPEDDLRVFTTGDLAELERDFYRLHQSIEKILYQAVEILFDCVTRVDLDSSQAIDLIEQAADLFLLEHKKFDPQAFKKLRPYFINGYDGEVPGPSGLFSPSIYALNNLFGIEGLPADYRMFPSSRLPKQFEACDLSHSSVACSHHEGMDIDPELRRAVLSKMAVFRGVHYKAVKYTLPQVAEGTGGVDNPAIKLRELLKRTKKAANDLTPKI